MKNIASGLSHLLKRFVVIILAMLVAGGAAAQQARPSFSDWLAAFRPDAVRFGIAEATLDEAFKGLTPDLSLPDLVLPGKTPDEVKGQAEFTRPPQDYVSERSIARLAAQGRELLARHRATLEAIEARFGVAPHDVLAIWGRETAFGGHRLRHDAIRALATQAYTGRRPEYFRRELLFALKLLQDGVVPREKLKSSWAGAIGLTQFMPSEYDALAVDFDGDGRKDIWSVGDALASAANQLEQKGWVRGQTWGYEVRLPEEVTCAEDGPDRAKPISWWLARGVRRVAGRTFRPEHEAVPAFLFSPGGAKGPRFLVLENFLVLKRYNTSDLYALFVGHLADRIAGLGSFAAGWGDITQIPSAQISAIQQALKDKGFTIGRVDGKIGPNTRSQIGQYQLKSGLAVDCWPTVALHRHLTSTPASSQGPVVVRSGSSR